MRFIALFLLAVITSFPVLADTPKVTIDLIPDQNAAVKGGQFNLAIRQNIADGWHTYWQNPGDSGEAMSVTWDVPEGVEIGAFQFPVPDKTTYGEGLTSYTMHGSPILTTTVSIPKNLKGNVLTLAGEAYWLVCEEICIPEKQNVSLTLPVSDTAQKINQDIFINAKTAMPRDLDWHSTVTEDGENIIFNVSVPKYETAKMTDVVIIPYDYGVVNNSSFAMTDIGDYGMVSFIQAKGDRDLSTLQDIPFIIKTGFDAFFINGENVASVSFFEETSLWWILLLAFLGGIVLNLMPCVFPVLSMKALSLVKLSDSERKQARLSGLAYTAGIILSFLLIAGLLIALKSGGAAIGWGFQLQNPWVIAFLIAIVIAVGLNLLGVFHISGGRLTSLGSRLTTGTGHGSSFWTGVLATAVATPCTAPFMATAVGFALTQNAVIALMVFAMLGAGLAFPYLLFCFIPAFQSILPKPGAWMETFRKILSIPMFLTALWLLWVLIQQLGLINHQITTDEPFTQKRLERVLLDNPGSPVFVDMTAAWCITCLVNKKTSIENERVQQAFEDNNVIYMVGDWTNKDAEIAAYLHQFGREGVPLYVYYETVDMDGVRPKPIVLPQILTPDIVIDTINGEI